MVLIGAIIEGLLNGVLLFVCQFWADNLRRPVLRQTPDTDHAGGQPHDGGSEGEISN